jgi:hypothetical protein
VAARALAERVLTLIPTAEPNLLGTLIGAVKTVGPRLGGADARIVAERALGHIIAAETELDRLKLFVEAVEAVGPRLSESDARIIADRALAQVKSSKEPKRIQAMLSMLESLAMKLAVPSLARSVHEISVFGKYRRRLVQTLKSKIAPVVATSWERPWDLVDWLEGHRSESPDIMEVERILHEQLPLSPTLPVRNDEDRRKAVHRREATSVLSGS